MIKPSRLGHLLINRGVIDVETLEKALRIQNDEALSTRRRLGEILVYDFKLDHDAVFGVLAEYYAFKTLQISPAEVDNQQIRHTQDILNRLSKELKRDLLYRNILPYQTLTRNDTVFLKVLAADPTDPFIEKIGQESTYKRYEVFYCPLSNTRELINLISPMENEFLDIVKIVGEQLEEYEEHGESNTVDEASLDEEINKSLLVNLFEGALMEAVRQGASDIHIRPQGGNAVNFFFRVDGKLMVWHTLDHTSPEAMAAVVKDRATGVDRFERDVAQDGFAQRLIDGQLVRFRISILPIISSEFERRFESIVIRVIDDRNVVTDLRSLGFQEKAEADFIRAISKSKGIILVTGPTGSGKSTTLMAALHFVINPAVNVLTCEDPVEYVIRGATQLKIGKKMNFDEAVRAILRHDPDVVMVGEIRDEETAHTAIKLANTGHLTFSTLHTNDAPSAVSRLYKMGVETFLLAYAINIIVAQRLVRKLCSHCRQPITPDHRAAALEMGLSAEELDSGTIYEPGPGCKFCHNGYKGRVNICEALYFTPEIRHVVAESRDNIDEEKIRAAARQQGMLSLLESGLDRIRHGLTSVSEVMYATSED